jgi:lactoylglutathione lyase
LELPTAASKTNPRPGIATLGTSKGLLELYHIPADASTPYTNGNDYSAPGVGFGHIGFTVPNVAETLDRVKTFGYEIIKPLDEAKAEQMGLPSEVVQGRQGEVADGYKHVFKQLAFIKDPDVSFSIRYERGHDTYVRSRVIG